MKKLLQICGWPILFGFIVSIGVICLKPELAGLTSSPMAYFFSPTTTLVSGFKQNSYNSAVKKATPAVVNISTKTVINQEKKFVEIPPHIKINKNNIETSLGSGVIINPNGFILTNNHVIQGADHIIVGLRDGREVYATVVGTDSDTDLAVLKIRMTNLPYIHLADSTKAKVGDIVLAIGNPFGLSQTVTMGIISATGRHNLQLNTYEDFIQTDAAINIGNSGGALINAYGDLIGVNTLLFSIGGGNESIGFAIPSEMARFVMNSIMRHGYVIRGWLGIESQSLNNSLAKAYQIDADAGILISGVYETGPADQAGLRRGDILIDINGSKTIDGKLLMNLVAQITPGSKVTLGVLRNGKKINLKALVAKRPTIINS
ncbi:MAG: trypsin-like peptidase domain-containing protein [Candidatus Endonucleobacter bathymodioli]|uniref:Trypsin-like peptidase domain-containing protein n=1 Tax=Candidatus Endonucleibacter bathymodioli TaxID=539814 RepID=A0AA90SNL5_9GAMM|nr:trypsin-like peptidase domain-containing protein [Candidatus Endonucleobacter bathymodioli]